MLNSVFGALIKHVQKGNKKIKLMLEYIVNILNVQVQKNILYQYA
jgi:hypothetical protein